MERYAEKFHAFIVLKQTCFQNFIKFHVYFICDRKSLRVIRLKNTKRHALGKLIYLNIFYLSK